MELELFYLNRTKSNNFDEELRVEKLNFRLCNIDGTYRLLNTSLCRNSFSLFVSLCFLFVICLDAVQKLFSAGGELEMLNANMNTFGNKSIPDLLINNDAN